MLRASAEGSCGGQLSHSDTPSPMIVGVLWMFTYNIVCHFFSLGLTKDSSSSSSTSGSLLLEDQGWCCMCPKEYLSLAQKKAQSCQLLLWQKRRRVVEKADSVTDSLRKKKRDQNEKLILMTYQCTIKRRSVSHFLSAVYIHPILWSNLVMEVNTKVGRSKECQGLVVKGLDNQRLISERKDHLEGSGGWNAPDI